MKNTLALKMRGIRKTFPGAVALDGVDLEVAAGEVHILLGENGAGKSTLMKILSGAYEKDAGEIFVDARKVEIKNPKHARELGISIIYQEFNLIPHLSAAENIFLGREPERLAGVIDQRKIIRAAAALLNELGISFDPRLPIRALSVAQQQMVEVAKALSVDAKILIMDEPTSALTKTEIQELFAAVRRLKEKSVAIIYISHRLEELFEIGDRVTILRDGKYIATHDIAEVSIAQLVRLMVNRELKEHFPKQRAPRGEELLRVEHVSNAKLKSISLTLRRGEVLGIAGLLGAGRTELARALFGADSIDAGKIFIENREVNIKSPGRAIKHGIGFLTEDRKTQGLVLNLSMQSNVSLPNTEKLSRFGVMRVASEQKLAAKYVGDLRIKTSSIRQKVMYLSGGNQQKVVLSKWLAGDAEVFIFDEPTRGIDVGAKVEIYQLMNRLTAQGKAIIMISSELPEILGMSDRILVMHQGRLSGEFSAEEATQEKILSAALGRNT